MHVRKWVAVRKPQTPGSGDSKASGSGGSTATSSETAAPAAIVSLSPAAQRAVDDLRLPGAGSADAGDGADPTGAADGASDAETGADGLTQDQEKVVRELEQRDRDVRAHEAAHQAAGGDMAGPASFTTETGPDGKEYAIGGEVPIQVSGGRTPEETLQRAERIRAAALAPADPSAQDLAVAAQAQQMEAQAQSQIAEQRSAQASASSGTASSGGSSEPAGKAAGAREKAVAQRALAAYGRAAA